jgi:zinc-ribbon domain
MPFCNSCGASLDSGTRFCSKCGAAIVGSSLPPTPSAQTATVTPAQPRVPAPVPAQGGSAVKTILIVVGAIILLGILCVGSLAIFGLRMAHRMRVRQEGGNVKVETPFGTVQTTKDPQAAARNLGVDVYPGAQVQDDGAAMTTFGGVHTTAANFESSDSVDKICSFYNSRFPNAMVKTSDANQCSIVSTDQKNIISINVSAQGGKSKITISNVTRSSGNSSSQ